MESTGNSATPMRIRGADTARSTTDARRIRSSSDQSAGDDPIRAWVKPAGTAMFGEKAHATASSVVHPGRRNHSRRAMAGRIPARRTDHRPTTPQPERHQRSQPRPRAGGHRNNMEGRRGPDTQGRKEEHTGTTPKTQGGHTHGGTQRPRRTHEGKWTRKAKEMEADHTHGTHTRTW